MEKKTILTVDDSPISCSLIEKFFADSFRILTAYSGLDALDTLRVEAVDLILLDVEMPEMDGYEVMQHLKLDAKTSGIPVIFLTGIDDRNDELKGLKMGAVDYIQKPFYPEILLQKIETAIERNEAQKVLVDLVQTKISEAEMFRRMAFLDPLTALWNRTYFENQVDLYLQEENPQGYFFILDIDNFKLINDQYGHIKGDEVLLELAEILRKASTNSVLTARLAGDEFVIFLKDVSDISYAKIFADSILIEISQINLEHHMNVTASVGIARITSNEKKFIQLYGKADTALYHAKKNGKGVYCFAS